MHRQSAPTLPDPPLQAHTQPPDHHHASMCLTRSTWRITLLPSSQQARAAYLAQGARSGVLAVTAVNYCARCSTATRT
jgi:hypothetical protein